MTIKETKKELLENIEERSVQLLALTDAVIYVTMSHLSRREAGGKYNKVTNTLESLRILSMHFQKDISDIVAELSESIDQK